MIDLSLSQLESSFFHEELNCKEHKRRAIAFCIKPDCSQGDRFACASCYAHPNIHYGHQTVEPKEILQIIKGGLPLFKEKLTQSYHQFVDVIINRFSSNLKEFVYKKAEMITQRYESCFFENLLERDQKSTQLLLGLYQICSTEQGNYIRGVCESKGKYLQNILKNELAEIKKVLNDFEFKWEIQRFDIENQVVHNLSKEALETFESYKNEIIFDQPEFENEFDQKLYLVNDSNFYTVSQFNKEGQRHGRAIEIPSYSHFFKGYIKNDQRNGHGLYIYEDGSVYVGMFRNNQKEGKGKLIKRDGYIYSGEWRDDQKNGQGVEKYNEDWIFEGFFDSNQRSGPGQETNKKLGQIIQAIYEKGEVNCILADSILQQPPTLALQQAQPPPHPLQINVNNNNNNQNNISNSINKMSNQSQQNF